MSDRFSRMGKRYPNTPDCAIKGCKKAAARLGMCQAHAALAGRTFSNRAWIEAAEASYKASRRVHREAARHVEDALRATR